MPRYFLREDTKDLTNWVNKKDKEQIIQVLKYDVKDGDNKKHIRYHLTILEWWDNPDVPEKSGYQCTHRLDCKKYFFEDNTSKEE